MAVVISSAITFIVSGDKDNVFAHEDEFALAVVVFGDVIGSIVDLPLSCDESGRVLI